MEKPILFSGPMVRAILDGRKTMTRRVVKSLLQFGQITEFQKSDRIGYDWQFRDRRYLWNDISDSRLTAACPYPVGTRLWVRETWAADIMWDQTPPRHIPEGQRVWYDRSDHLAYPLAVKGRNRSSIHMPRWASRITLEVTGVRVERLTEISDEDVFSEGIERAGWGAKLHDGTADMPVEPKTAFAHL